MSIRHFAFLFISSVVLISLVFGSLKPVSADDSCSQTDLQCLQKKIDDYQQKIGQLQGKQKTLASEISYFDNKISLTQAQIAKTEQEIIALEDEIAQLSVKIGKLDTTLDDISKLLNERIGAAYQSSKFEPLYLLLSSNSFSSFLTREKYLKVAEAHDHQLMMQMEQQKQNYDNQKNLKEKKQQQAESLKKVLDSQKITLAKSKQEKQTLLSATKNDEQKYQQLLATARAELQAIQSIIAGNGKETEVGSVSTHTRIATVITGTSACSSGTHLHFEINSGGSTQNPASNLKTISVVWDNSPDGQFSFGGSWDWPLDEPVRITQGFGSTYWSRMGWYGGGPHTGIDIVSDTSSGVKAVADGTLYRGAIACGGGTLRYVHVKHKDGGMDSYYLHVNYY